jgi:hypothetical protein
MIRKTESAKTGDVTMAVRGLLRRTANYGLSRVGLGEQKVEILEDEEGNERIRIRRSPVQLVHASLRDGWSRVKARPDKWDPAGYRGRYPDGGRAAFRRAMETKGIAESQLPEIASGWRRQAGTYFAGSLAMFALTVAIALTEGTVFGFALAFGAFCMALLLLAMGLAADFSRWRVRERRMGGLAEYLAGLTGSTGRKSTLRHGNPPPPEHGLPD